MRKLYIFIFAVLISYQGILAQEKNDSTEATLFLRKPLININEPNGGYYTDIIDRDLKSIYCAAEIENMGDTVKRLNFEVILLDYNKEEMYSAQTTPFNMVSGTDILELSEPILMNDVPDSYRCKYLVYTLKSNYALIDHCSDTVLMPMQHDGDWGIIARSSTPNKYIDIKDLGIQSGDFIGTKNMTSYTLNNCLFFLQAEWPESLEINFQAYQEDELIYSAPLDKSYNGWRIPNHDGIFLELEETTLGLEFIFEEGASFEIGVDTTLIHNFEVESAIRQGGVWASSDFVLCMSPEYNPESIGEAAFAEMKVYPNPSMGSVYFEQANYKSIEVISLEGKVVHRIANQQLASINLSHLNNGYYFVKFESNNEIKVAKIQLQK